MENRDISAITQRGSLFETKTWIAKAKARKLIDEDEFTNLVSDMGNIGCQTQ